MAGDTRLSYIRGVNLPPEDDHVKVDGTGDFAIAGYTGNSAIATSVYRRLEEAIIRTGDYSPNSIASLAKNMLVSEDSRNHSVPLSYRLVQVLLGIRDSKTNRFVLYEMTTDTGFEPQPRDGMAAIGSHAKYAKEAFEDIRREAAQNPGDPFKVPLFTLKEGLASLVWLLVEKAIEVAAGLEGRKSLIGGRPHLVVLHANGAEAMNPDENANLYL
jgi:ATP-dependent protease HslVU (ClpYQ) peptidase subunit